MVLVKAEAEAEADADNAGSELQDEDEDDEQALVSLKGAEVGVILPDLMMMGLETALRKSV